MKKRRPANLITPKPSTPTTGSTYPSALSGPVAVDGIIYFVCTVSHQAFLDWRYSPLGHAEIDRALRSCQSIKIWFPKSDNLIYTLTRHNIGTLTTGQETPE